MCTNTYTRAEYWNGHVRACVCVKEIPSLWGNQNLKLKIKLKTLRYDLRFCFHYVFALNNVNCTIANRFNALILLMFNVLADDRVCGTMQCKRTSAGVQAIGWLATSYYMCFINFNTHTLNKPFSSTVLSFSTDHLFMSVSHRLCFVRHTHKIPLPILCHLLSNLTPAMMSMLAFFSVNPHLCSFAFSIYRSCSRL